MFTQQSWQLWHHKSAAMKVIDLTSEPVSRVLEVDQTQGLSHRRTLVDLLLVDQNISLVTIVMT